MLISRLYAPYVHTVALEQSDSAPVLHAADIHSVTPHHHTLVPDLQSMSAEPEISPSIHSATSRLVTAWYLPLPFCLSYSIDFARAKVVIVQRAVNSPAHGASHAWIQFLRPGNSRMITSSMICLYRCFGPEQPN